MNWNDLEIIWRKQELPRGVDADVATLEQTFEAKSRKLAVALMMTDVSEASAGVLGSVAFGFIWWQQKKVGWPIAFAILLILGVTAVFIRERLRTRRNRAEPGTTLLVKLDADIAELRRRRRLVLSMWRWYLAPIAGAIIIVGATISMNRPPWDIARDPYFLAGFALFFAGTLWFAWVINRRAVQKQIEPRLAELEKLRENILSTG
jgi:hypothetical protein